ncbi:MAG: MFS transporter [bacterium]|nr:MFS transporter [bacterium]
MDATLRLVMPHYPPVTRREIVSWAMFDVANSAYTTIIVTVAFSIYFTKLVAPGDNADWWWSVAVAISNLIVLVLAPILGAIADGSGRKKPFLVAMWLLCCLGTASLYFVTPGALGVGIVLFVASNCAYAFGETLVGGFLPEISTPANIGRISGFGWGLGYLGGLGSLILVKPLIAGGFSEANLSSLRAAWVVTGLFFLVGALPTVLFLRERTERTSGRSVGAYAADGFKRIAATWRSLKQFSELAWFLGAFFVYSCGLMAVIAFAAIYAERTIGFSPSDIITLFIALQVAAATGAVLFGWIQDQLGPKRSLELALLLWLVVSVGAYFSTTKLQFWPVAIAAGLGIGSLQSASRALVGLFSPVAKSGEFFGFWGLAMRAAYVTGVFIFGSVSSATGSQRIAILVNGAFFLVGLVALGSVDVKRGRAAAEAWDREEREASA